MSQVHNKLSQRQLVSIVSLLSAKAELVIKNHNELVPVGKFSDIEKLEFIVAALCYFGRAVDQDVASVACNPPYISDALGFSDTNPSVVHKWAFDFPDGMHRVAALIYLSADIPSHVKDNEEWCCILALTCMVNWARSIGKWEGHVPDNEALNLLFEDWMRAHISI